MQTAGGAYHHRLGSTREEPEELLLHPGMESTDHHDPLVPAGVGKVVSS